jgi:integrase
MPRNNGTRHKPKWQGKVEYKGHQKWVGTYESLEDYNRAKERCLNELRDEVDHGSKQRVPTVLEFSGAIIHDNGRVTMTWPDGESCEKETGRRESTVKRARDGLKPFIREFHDRPLDGFTRDEAVTWTRPKGANTQQSVRQFFNHAVDRELIPRNLFTKLGASKKKRRVDRPDFEILSDEKYNLLLSCARKSRTDDHGLVIEGAALCVGETAMRPGEVFGLHRPDIHWTENMIHVRWQTDLDSGKVTWPKDDAERWVPMSPRLRAHLETMPRRGKTIYRDKGEIVFPATRGGYMLRSTWSNIWHSVRASAGLPSQEFYELKHRAIQWMVDPVEDGGLGLDPATVAEIVGHDDGGYLIATVYTKLGRRRALERAQRAMKEYERRQAPPATTRRLHVVSAA